MPLVILNHGKPNQIKVHKGFGWKPQKKDIRDKIYCPKKKFFLPSSIDLTQGMPDCWDQEQLGSCTSQGISFTAQYRLIKESKPSQTNINSPSAIPSRLFIYRQERFIEGGEEQVLVDSGATIRDGIKAIADKGFPFEDSWPYSDNTDDSKGKIPPFVANPPHNVWGIAWHFRIQKYEAVNPDVNSIKAALANGNPVVFGFTVYDSFNDIGNDGLMPVPKPTEKIEGGHCVVFVGFNDKTGYFKTRNSWSPAWGQNGYFYFPYQCVDSLASDFWVISSI